MLKPFTRYSLAVNASVATGLAAQVMCYQDTVFVGRIDFTAGQPPSASYFWNVAGTPLVLSMPIERLPTVLEALHQEGSLALELHGQAGSGASTPGFGGRLKTVESQAVGAHALTVG